jgi:hypothetical protein
MAAGSTYTPIATTTLGSNQTSYTFSSIPSTYTDLVLVVVGKMVSGAYDTALRFNGDTGTNYSRTVLTGDGSVAASGRSTSTNVMYIDANGVKDTTFNSNDIIHIMNYANTTTYKTAISRSNNAATGVDASVGLWRNTAAITSVEVLAFSSGTWATGSTFTLYGIAAA